MAKFLECISKQIVMFLFTLLIAALSIISLVNTCYQNSNEYTYFTFESFTGFLLPIIIVVALFFIFQRDKEKLTTFLSVRIMLLVAFCLGILFLILGQMSPRADQRLCLAAAKAMHKGNFDIFRPRQYMQIYPQQVGLVFVYYLLGFIFWGGPHAGVIQVLNVIAYTLFIYGTYKLTKQLFKEEMLARLSVLLCVLFLPLLFYTCFVYGTMIGLAASTFSFYFAMRYMETNANRYGIFCALLAGFSVQIKKNYLIVVVALLLMLILYSICKKHLRTLIYVSLIVVCYLFFTIMPQYATEKITGISIGKGLPSIAWVTMGLQEGPRAEGWYNDYSIHVYQDNDNDTERTSTTAKKELVRRLNKMYTHPKYALGFFTKKTLSQWSEPTFQCFFVSKTYRKDSSFASLFSHLFTGRVNAFLLEYLDLLQTMIYLGVFLFLLYDWKKIRIWDLFPAIIFIGGFLFHLVWEAKGQYALCYFVLLFPYTIKGYSSFFEALRTLRTTYKESTLKGQVRLLFPALFLILACISYSIVSVAVPSIHSGIQKSNARYSKYLALKDNPPVLIDERCRFKSPTEALYLGFTKQKGKQAPLVPVLQKTKNDSQELHLEGQKKQPKITCIKYNEVVSPRCFRKHKDENLEKRYSIYSTSKRVKLYVNKTKDGLYYFTTTNGYAVTRSTDGTLILEAYSEDNLNQKWIKETVK